MILERRGLWKAVKQGRRSGDVLACPSEVREGSIVGEDPLVYITGRGACAPTASTMFDLMVDLRVLVAFDLVVDLCVLAHEV